MISPRTLLEHPILAYNINTISYSHYIAFFQYSALQLILMVVVLYVDSWYVDVVRSNVYCVGSHLCRCFNVSTVQAD